MMALWDYKSDQNGDLQFKEGDVISDVKPTSLGADWLQGKCNGRQGVFPANFVTEMVASLQGSKFAMRIRTIAKNCEAKRIRFASLRTKLA